MQQCFFCGRISGNGKLYVVGADFEERFCRPTKMLEKGAKATNTVAYRTAIYKLLQAVNKKLPTTYFMLGH